MPVWPKHAVLSGVSSNTRRSTDPIVLKSSDKAFQALISSLSAPSDALWARGCLYEGGEARNRVRQTGPTTTGPQNEEYTCLSYIARENVKATKPKASKLWSITSTSHELHPVSAHKPHYGKKRHSNECDAADPHLEQLPI